MSIYPVVLFLHIVGAIGYFLGIGIWLFILLGFWPGLSDDHQAEPGRLPHRDGGRAAARSGSGRARLADETRPRTADGGPKGAGQRADWLSSWYGEQG
jgi:hypothetical protein